MLKINSIEIDHIGPIKNLGLNFDPHFNIICGQNGIGKTTILDCLAQSFAPGNSTIKKTANSAQGSWAIDIVDENETRSKSFEVKQFLPTETNRDRNGFYKLSNNVIVFKTHRDIPYQKLSGISTATNKSEVAFAMETLSGSLPNDLKNWFVTRYLFSGQDRGLDEGQIKNFNLAKECFNILDTKISFSRVITSSFDILLTTELGEIYFEYLSSGYKSCLAVLLGLIKEIELRYMEPSKFIKDYNGIVFIDEIDLHLHPEWQAKIYNALKLILPKAQIFTSTHSPHIIQVANPNEIISLIKDAENNIAVNPLVNQDYGCQGWTVEEVLRDVMGMGETRTDTYLNAINSFNTALDEENVEKATAQFYILDKMLHPENSLRKIMKIQLAGL